MKIEYRVIVADDQPKYIGTALAAIKKRIELEGFLMIHELVSRKEDLANLHNRKNFSNTVDLLLVDRKLGLPDGQDGASIIRKLRAKAPHIPVLFYSGEPDKLKDRILKERVEGVFCCDRKHLEHNCINLFIAHTRFYLRPLAHRGFFVGGVSELEHSLREAVCLCVEQTAAEGMADLKTRLQEIVADSINSFEAYKETIIKEDSLDLLLDGRKVSGANMLELLQHFIGRHAEPSNVSGFAHVLSSYLEEVIHTRNVLAHGTLSQCGKHIKLGSRNIELGESSARQHREWLYRHTENINGLLKYLRGLNADLSK